MDNPQDCLVTSSQDVIQTNGPSTSGHPATTYQTKNGRKKKLKSGNEQFLWFASFQKLCRSVLGSSSMQDLLNVITVYTEHVSRDVIASYSKPNRAAKLKTNMISMLGYFHNCYIAMKEPFDESAYLEKMSNLLTMYFDMEVKASRRGKESVKRITSKLISALFIILNNSAEYILDTILKARFTVKSYSEICIPIFKMVTHLPQSQEMNYVRCLLVFKLWKRMLPCREERNSINRLAVSKLSPPPAQVLEFIKRGLLAKVLPTPPPDKKPPLVTRFYMTKKFNLRESIKAFLKMEAELKLNDFTSALDSIRFLDEEEDVVAVENNFEKDYSLLESIWIDISNSPASPDHSSLSSPSTSGSTPLGVAFSRNSETSCVLEPDKSTPSKVKKSLFKPKTSKKNKQQKSKSKDKSKKKKEDFVIDLCKEYEENCSEVIEKPSAKLKSRSDVTTEMQVCEKISPSSTGVDDFTANPESEASVSSASAPKVNLSEDSKSIFKLNENNLLKNNMEEESKMLVKTLIKSEAPVVSKSYLDSISKSKVCDILSPSPAAVSDFSTTLLLEAAVAPQSVSEVNSNDNFKLNCNLKKQNQEKTNPDQESKVEAESINSNVLVESKDIKIVSRENEDMKTESENEPNLVTASKDVTEAEMPSNKILISCKNFSKIGFKHEETEQQVDNLLNEDPEELVSSIEIVEDLILKTEGFKEDILNNDEKSAEKSVEKIEQSVDAGEVSWDNNLKAKSPGIELSTDMHSLSHNICNKDLRNTRLNVNPEINQSPKPDIVGDFFHKERMNLNKEVPSKPIGESVEEVVLQVAQSPKDDSSTSFERKISHVQNYLQETKTRDKINKTFKNKTVNNTGNDIQNIDIIVEPANKSLVEPSEVIPKVPEIVYLKLGTKDIQKSPKPVHELKKRQRSPASSDNSNQGSFEVSSSSFEDSYQVGSNSASSIPFNPLIVENQQSKSCKVENELFKEFSACMKSSGSSVEPVRSQIKEKCDENTEVPPEQPIYVTNNIKCIAGSQSSPIPKSDKHNKQVFNLHKGLNTCLLHKILGEEDCLKSGCLLKNSKVEKLPQDHKESGFPGISLKQELENSSELPSENSTSTIPSLWNPIAGIKLEKDHENNRNSECIEGMRSTSSEFLIRSVTEACNFKELDYNIGNECDNLTASYDCDSDCEDRNLVIDEDNDSIKDQNETEDIQLKYGIDRVQNDAGNNTVSSVLVTNNNTHLKGLDQTLWDKNMPCEIRDIAIHHTEQPNEMNCIKTMEDESLKKELAGKHKMPRIVESNIKTSSLRNSYANETLMDSTVKYRPLNKSEVLFTTENCAPYNSAQHYKEENSSVNTGVPKHYTQPKIINRSDGNVNLGQTSPSCGVFSPYPVSHGNDSNNIRGKNRDPRLRSSNVNSSYHLKSNASVQSNINIQSHNNKSLESISTVNQPLLSSELSKAASPRLVSSPGRFEAYTQYNMGSKMSVPSNQSSGTPVEQYCVRSPIGNDKYISLEKIHCKRDSPIRNYQESSVNNASHTNLSTYAEGGKSKDNSNSAFHSYKSNEPQKTKPRDALYDNSISSRDPLCLVKTKEDLRETYDFEFNVFPIAQEVEICSGSENVGGEWLYPASSEIGHPDWPIANEQNVIDSSVSYSQPSDQFMFSTMMKSDQVCVITEGDQPCYIPLELQQIDNRHPNIVGKNINKEKLNLHLRTLEGDHNLCCSQSEFKEFYLSRDVPPTIPVPFPPQGRTDNLNSSVRCPCEQCLDNHQKLLANYNVLTHFRNSKIKPLSVFPKSDETYFPEKDLNGEFDSSLPLKKRKTLTNSKVTEELVLPSYPNTPMISIAQLELTGYEQGNQVIVPNPQSQWRDSMAYNPLNLVQPPSLPYDGQTKGKRKASKRRKSSR